MMGIAWLTDLITHQETNHSGALKFIIISLEISAQSEHRISLPIEYYINNSTSICNKRVE